MGKGNKSATATAPAPAPVATPVAAPVAAPVAQAGPRAGSKNAAILAALTATPQTMQALVAAAATANPAISFAGRTFYNLCNGLYRANRIGKSALGFYLLPAPVGPATAQAPVSA